MKETGCMSDNHLKQTFMTPLSIRLNLSTVYRVEPRVEPLCLK